MTPVSKGKRRGADGMEVNDKVKGRGFAMRSSLKSLVAVVAALLVVPTFASADEMGGDDTQEILARMADLEQQLRATNDALAAANARVDQLGKREGAIPQPAGVFPALSRFLRETTFDGWVTTSYFYNTNNPDNGATIGSNIGAGNLPVTAPFHPNSNSFQVDQVWFSMENEATVESRAGFQIDLLWGETADVLNLLGGNVSNSNVPYLFNANVSYLAPISDAGIKVTAGRFQTHIGAEVVQAPMNFNITRGLVFTSTQPINHTGVKMESEYDNGLSWMLGLANTAGYGAANLGFGAAPPFGLAPGQGFGANNADDDDSKTFLWHLGYRMSDEWSVALNGLYGDNCIVRACANPGTSNDRDDEMGIVDLVINWDPTEKLSTWLNFDYVWTESRSGGGAVAGGGGTDPTIWGVAMAGRYAITDLTGVAIRAEYLRVGDTYVTFANNRNAEEDYDLWSITGTVDHAVTEHLTLRGEVSYQQGESEDGRDGVFFQDRGAADPKDSQVLLGVEMTYRF